MKVFSFVAAFLCALVLRPGTAAAQMAPAEGTDHSAVYLEFGGNGLLYSVNYEMRFLDSFSARAGFGFFNVTVYEADTRRDEAVGVALIPLMVNAFYGSGSHQLEVGVGPLIGMAGTGVDRVERGPAAVEVKDFGIAGYTSGLGYRYQPRRGGLMLRATLTPFYSGEAQLWGGISLGLTH
jgi:hypothetical protein